MSQRPELAGDGAPALYLLTICRQTSVFHYRVFYVLHVLWVQMTVSAGYNESGQGAHKEQPAYKEAYPVGVEYSILYGVQDSGTGKSSTKCRVKPLFHERRPFAGSRQGLYVSYKGVHLRRGQVREGRHYGAGHLPGHIFLFRG